MAFNKAYNFKQINKLISTSGTIKYIDVSKVSDDGYALVINLLPDDNEHARENEKADFDKQNIQYVYLPIDWDKPTDAEYLEFESVMNQFKDKKIHIHCAANFRVTAFYGVYACRNLGWTKEQCIELTSVFWDVSKFSKWQRLISVLIETN